MSHRDETEERGRETWSIRGIHPTAASLEKEEVGISVLEPQELNSANHSKEQRNGFFLAFQEGTKPWKWDLDFSPVRLWSDFWHKLEGNIISVVLSHYIYDSLVQQQ